MHLLIDLDGTLTDSRPGIIACLQHALTESNLAVPSAENLMWCIGPPLIQSIQTLVGPDSAHLYDITLQTYRERYSEVGLFENELYPEIVESLTELKAQGHILHVATSKAVIYARRIIDHYGLAPFFTSVDGSELDGTRADKATLIAYIMDREGIAKNDACMIGDREHDIIGAVKNGIPGIGALWGYGSGKELMAAGATACVRLPRFLSETIDSLT